jgi:hypothetical protein
MAEENKSDIHIGEIERIRWINFDASSNSLFELIISLQNMMAFGPPFKLFVFPAVVG